METETNDRSDALVTRSFTTRYGSLVRLIPDVISTNEGDIFLEVPHDGIGEPRVLLDRVTARRLALALAELADG